ncbi:hypothetical protein [Flavobacterium sp.]|uniref:hypothetical protein n=1 Tax=Flavobacterium sp. TaxID=239 RepID=UPI003753DA73
MNSSEQNNYIQYVTKLDIVKTKSVIFEDNGTNTTFKVQGIIEDFFILSVFQNNIRVLGVGFDDIENNDMLGFLNSESQDLALVPRNAFLSSEQVVTMSYNNEYLKEEKNKLKTNEEIFFKEYLQMMYPNKKYIIRPFIRTTSEIPEQSNRVYYCTVFGAISVSNREHATVSVQTQTHNYQIFASLQSQVGVISFLGYEAVCETEFFNIPLPDPEIPIDK